MQGTKAWSLCPQCLSASTVSELFINLLLTVHVRTVCVETEQNNEETIGRGSKDCLISENSIAFWKKVDLLVILL